MLARVLTATCNRVQGQRSKAMVRGQRSRLQLEQNALEIIAHNLLKKDVVLCPLSAYHETPSVSVVHVATLVVKKYPYTIKLLYQTLCQVIVSKKWQWTLMGAQ